MQAVVWSHGVLVGFLSPETSGPSRLNSACERLATRAFCVVCSVKLFTVLLCVAFLCRRGLCVR